LRPKDRTQPQENEGGRTETGRCAYANAERIRRWLFTHIRDCPAGGIRRAQLPSLRNFWDVQKRRGRSPILCGSTMLTSRSGGSGQDHGDRHKVLGRSLEARANRRRVIECFAACYALTSTTVRPRTFPWNISSTIFGTSAWPTRCVIEASLPRSRSCARRDHAASRTSLAAFTESIPASVTFRKMNGRTDPGWPTP
jgi:hypothetical protein